MGVLNISLFEVDLWTLAEITAALHWKREEDKADFRNGWEQTRMLAAYIISPYSKEKISSLQKFMPFEWDEATKPMKPVDKAKMFETLRKLDEMHLREMQNNGK